MKIAGLQKTSLIDYPGKMSAIIFTQGCPFRCGYCHNPELLPVDGDAAFTEEEIFDFLAKRKNVLDAIVITGGEPTMQADLPEFIKKVRDLDYLVKLDTNGTHPDMLKKMLAQNLLDYIAMDIKAPLKSYDKITNIKTNLDKIEESIKLIMSSGVSYEFRSTILPALHTEEDIKEMAKLISGAPKYYLQKFLNQGKLQDSSLSSSPAFTTKEMEKFKKICLEFVEKCEIR